MSKIHIRDVEAGVSISALCGASTPKLTGYGGWEVRDRPKDIPITTWKGSQAKRLAIDLIFDGYVDKISIREDVNLLASWAEARLDTASKRPTRLEVWGLLIPSGRGRRWVIEDLQFGEGIGDWSDRLLRQQVSLTLLEYEAVDLTKIKVASSSYKVRKGDTMKKIARKILGDGTRWREIKKLNPKLRDPNAVIKTGKILKMPFV